MHYPHEEISGLVSRPNIGIRSSGITPDLARPPIQKLISLFALVTVSGCYLLKVLLKGGYYSVTDLYLLVIQNRQRCGK